MIWLWTSILSALLLGLYDIAKKRAVRRNGGIQVLLVSTFISTLILIPVSIKDSLLGGTLSEHAVLAAKSALVTLSWICGIFAIKHLPLTTVGIVKASRPVFILIGCIIIFSERPNPVQFSGIMLAMAALYLLGRSSRLKEGIDFAANRWVWCLFASVFFGVCSALIDKFVMLDHDPLFVQTWCNVYITLMLAAVLGVTALSRSRGKGRAEAVPFSWDWSILLISVFLTASDFLYFYSLSFEGSMLSVISMLRRSSVIVTFVGGAILFKEGNLRSKSLDLALLMIAMAMILFGSYL